MGYPVKQSTTAQPLLFLMVGSADHITGATGLTPTVTISKAGGSFASPAGAVTEVGNGWYKVAGNATDNATLGPLVLHAEGTGADPTDEVYEVVAYDPQDAVRLGLTALPNAAAAASGGLITRGTSTGQLNVSGGRADSDVLYWNAAAVATPNVAGAPIVDLTYWRGSTPNTLQSARVDCHVATVANAAITASAIATGAIGAAQIASDAVTEIQNGLSTYDGTDTSGVTTLLSRLTSSRAGYLDNLNVGGLVASQTEVTGSAAKLAVLVVPAQIEVPNAATIVYRVEIYLYDANGNMQAPDSAPTITLVNQSGTDRSARLSATTMVLVSTGRYRVTYTATAGDTVPEQLLWNFTTVVSAVTRNYGFTSLCTDGSAVDFTTSDRAIITAIKASTDNLPADPASTTDVNTRLADADYTAPDNASIALIKVQTDKLAFDGSNYVQSAVMANNDKTGYTASLPSSGLDAVIVESDDSINVRQALSLILSAHAGVLTGAATSTIVTKAAGDATTTRITATVDADGNRSSVTLSPPA